MSQERVKVEKEKAKVIELEERRKRMKFTAQQRIVLLGMFPREGEYFNIRKQREVREVLAFNDDEQKVIETETVFVPGGSITNWKKVDKTIALKVLDVGEWLASYFRSELKKQYDDKKIREDTVDLYDIFCGTPQE